MCEQMPAGAPAGRASLMKKRGDRGMADSGNANDFSKGSIARNIMDLAVPMTLAQLINVMYSIVD